MRDGFHPTRRTMKQVSREKGKPFGLLCQRLHDLKNSTRKVFGMKPVDLPGWSAATESAILTAFKAHDRALELAYWVTASVHEKKVDEIDKPDGIVLEACRLFVQENQQLFAEVVLSGGDE